MTKINDPNRDILQSEDFKQQAKEAKEMFAWKPFMQEHEEMVKVSNVAQYIVPLLSIATGTFFFVSGAFRPWPLWLSIPTVLIVIGGLEFLKNYLSSKGWLNYYSKKEKNYLFASLPLLAISIFISVSGAKSIFENVDDNVISMDNKYNLLIDSARIAMDLEIAELKADKKVFETSNVVWINNEVGKVFNHKLTPQLQAYEARIDTARNEAKLAIAQIEARRKSDISIAVKDSGFNAWTFAMIALFIELLIVGSVWFPIYANYRLAIEKQQLTGESQLLQFDMPTLNKLLQFAGMAGLPQQMQPISIDAANTGNRNNLVPQNPIGFHFVPQSAADPLKVVPQNGNTLGEPLKFSPEYVAKHLKVTKKGSNYLAKYPHLCSDIVQKNEGRIRTTNEELAKFHGVSTDTLYRVQVAIIG